MNLRLLPVVAVILAGCAGTPPPVVPLPSAAPVKADPEVLTRTAAIAEPGEDVPVQTATTLTSSPSSSPEPCPTSSSSASPCARYGENPSNPPIEPVVTFAKYSRVAEGMSYEQVVAIFGRSGENTFWFRIEEQSSARYRWRNPDASYAEIWFTNNHLANKTNVNLR